ncbi:protein LIFEGUARD [Trifolium repens]|nr:protein LIFEGUARD [Trifolium repens]
MESGENSIYHVMHDDIDIPQKRIPFIWKVFSIITFQLYLTIVIVSVVVFIPPIANFFDNLHDNVLEFVTFFAFCSLFYYHKKHPTDYFFLLIFTVSIALSIGLKCVFIDGKIIILKVVTLTTALVISLSLHIFWTTKRGCDFISLDSFFFGVSQVLIFVGLIQILFPFEKFSYMIYGFLASGVVYGFTVYTTDHLIERFSDAQYIWVPAGLYLHVTNLFLYLLLIFSVLEFIKNKKLGLLS